LLFRKVKKLLFKDVLCRLKGNVDFYAMGRFIKYNFTISKLANYFNS
jgi:hypothetical protein